MEVSVRVFYPEPPAYAESAPGRAVYVGDAAGRCEVFAWDVAGGTRRQLTDRPQGTVACAIEPSGTRVWWFDDDLSGVGIWRTQPFEGGVARPSGFPPGRAAGLAMSLDGTAVAGVGMDRDTAVYLAGPDRRPRLVDRLPGYAQVVDLSPDATMLALASEPDAPDAVTVITLATGSRTVLSGTDHQLWAAGFAAGPGPERLLLTMRTANGYRLAVWAADSGLTALDWCVFDTEISPSWYPDGRHVLVRQDRHARSTLQVIDLQARSIEHLETPPGGILAAAAQPDGDLHYVWTDSVHPPRLCTASGRRPPEAGPEDVPTACRRDLWVPTPAGTVHTLLTLPDSPGPHPAVFLLHGGPFDAARDAYDPLVSVFVSIGCAVVRPNYRGSVGYGAGWRDRFEGGVGLTQLDDVAAVRGHLVDSGLIDAERTAVCGQSWGGYLALLAAGVQPDLWRAVAAVNPIADYPAAFHETTDAVRALDVRLFGGPPSELPSEYERSSPATYAAAVRAPVLIIAGSEDPKCPPGQIRGYVEALRRGGGKPTLEWTTSGHEGFDTGVHVRTLASVVGFVATAMGGRPAPAPAGAG
ncbi:MAG: S9 family peptidase [Catenulispora sp.]